MARKARATGSERQPPDGPRPSTRRTPTGASADRILSVGERLFAEKGFANVTVREIAAAAGVTHPVIYDHFGSKQGLLTAVLERTQARRRVITAKGLGPRQAVTALARDTLEGSQNYIRILGRAFLDGMPPGDWPGGYPGLEHALTVLTAGGAQDETGDSDREVRTLLATALATLLGWMLLEDQIIRLVGLDDADRAAVREEVLDAFGRTLEPAFAEAERRESHTTTTSTSNGFSPNPHT